MNIRYVWVLVVGTFLLHGSLPVYSAENELFGRFMTPQEVRQTARTFIDYYGSIPLTRQQKAIKDQALDPLPAPCCHDFSARTCCCPCNLAKSIWGLSHYLIAEKGHGVVQVRQTVKDWINTTNPNGYSGNSCFTGRCNLPFHENGCAGMNEKHIF